jgi:hypothetical protein
MTTAATFPHGTDLWKDIRADCERLCSGVSFGKGTLAQAIEWEILKLQTRLASAEPLSSTDATPLFRNRHVHVGVLIRLWRSLALETEAWLAAQGYETLLDVGPWGGFNFVLEPDGYTRMPFARLTLAVGGLAATPLQEQGGPLFDYLLPRYRAELWAAGVAFPDLWTYQFPKRDATGRLLEVSGTHYLPTHSYDRRTFIKVRASRACETVEEIALQDFLLLLERLQFTSDWVVYREQTKDVDARFDLQDFISLNHMVEGIYQRSSAEDRLLHEIKDAFRGAIRDTAGGAPLSGPGHQIALGGESVLGLGRGRGRRQTVSTHGVVRSRSLSPDSSPPADSCPPTSGGVPRAPRPFRSVFRIALLITVSRLPAFRSYP